MSAKNPAAVALGRLGGAAGMNETTLTQEQGQQLKQLKAHFPFRIVWGTLSPDGQFETYATYDKRKLNAASRKGQPVWMVS